MLAGPSLKSRGYAKRLLSAHVTSLRLEAGGARLRLALVRQSGYLLGYGFPSRRDESCRVLSRRIAR